MPTPKFEAPINPGPDDLHHEVPFTDGEHIIADADRTAETARAGYVGGGEILKMDPAKRAHDLEQLAKLRERYGKPRSGAA